MNQLCEKVGQGFICVYDNTGQNSKGISFIDFKVFASEESYQSFLNGI